MSVVDVLLLLLLLASVAAAIAAMVVTRRRGGAASLVAAVGLDLLTGLLAAGLGVGHLIGVVGLAVRRADRFAYDFRFASLLLVGLTVVAAGATCALAARGLTRRDPIAWRRARAGVLLLLLANAPLVPIQGFAIGLAAFGAVTLALLLIARPA